MEQLSSLGIKHFVVTIIMKIQRYTKVVGVLVVITMHMLEDMELYRLEEGSAEQKHVFKSVVQESCPASRNI